MKKVFTLFALLMMIVVGAQADTTWEMSSLSSTVKKLDGLDYYLNKAVSDLPSKSSDSSAKTFEDESQYTDYVGTGGASGFQLKNDAWNKLNRVFAFDVNANDVIKVYFCGGGTSNRSMYVSYNASTTDRDANTAFASATADGYTPTILTGTATTSGTVYLWCDNNVRVYAIKVKSGATTAPAITTDLSSTANVTVGVAQDFTIAATGATSYQWYTCDDAEKTNPAAIQGATSATYSYTAAAAGTQYIYCVASNAIGGTPSTVCAVTATAPTSAPTITTNLEAAYNVIKGQTQELSIVAEDASSYQWYVDGAAVAGATSASYTFTAGSTIGATNAVYCAAINAAGATNSVTATITTIGRSDCELTNIKFSNGAYGAINNATYGDGTIAVPYIAGTSAPTVEEASINISDGATYVLSGNTLTVTAEDETTSKEYTINAVEITPLTVSADVAETSFTEVPSWVFNLYGWDSSKGLKFAKAVNDADNMRIAKGNTRQYYFIGAAKSLTLTQIGSKRKVNVYVNGTRVISDTNNDALGAITLDETAPCMVMIESNQTGGDGGFSAYAIEAVPAPTTETITIPSDGVLTYVTQNPVDFSSIDGTIKAYVVTATSTTSAATAEVAAVPAGTPLLIKGVAGDYDVEIVESADAPATNLLQVSNGTVTGGDNIYAYSKSALKFKKVAAEVTIPEGKCYLEIDGNGGDALDIIFDGEATGINDVNAGAEAAAPVKVLTAKGVQIGKFNVAGQQVK